MATTVTYWAFAKTDRNPGAGLIKVYIQADTPFNAYQMLKAMYGELLHSPYAMPA